MTNSDKYKSAKERSDAFWSWYKGFSLPHDAVEAFADWLDLEAPAEEPLPCPFCGAEIATHFDAFCWWMQCPCGYRAPQYKNKESAISAHNRVARSVAKEKEANDANA